MKDLNEINILGRITSDITVKHTPNGNKVATFSVATNKSYVDAAGIKQDVATFHSMVGWNKVAEILENYGAKGLRVFIKGELQNKSWEDQSGQKKYRTDIFIKDFTLLDFKKETEGVKRERVEEEITIEDIPF